MGEAANSIFFNSEEEIVGEKHMRLPSKEHQRRKDAIRRHTMYRYNLKENLHDAVEEYNDANYDVLEEFLSMQDLADALPLNAPVINHVASYIRFPDRLQRLARPDKNDYVLRTLMRGGRLPSFIKSAILRYVSDFRIDDDEDDEHYLESPEKVEAVSEFLHCILSFKKQVLWISHNSGSMVESIQTAIDNFGDLLHGVNNVRLTFGYSNVYHSETGFVCGVRAVVRLNLDYPRAVINVPRYGNYVVNATKYTVLFKWSVIDQEFQYNEILGKTINGGAINPHVGGGTGGGACLGGYSYAIAQCAATNEWGQLAYTLMQYNTDCNMDDTWGRHITRNTKLYRVMGTKELATCHDEGSDGFRGAIEVAGEGFMKQRNTIYPAEDYVQCYVTGYPVKRENAHRLPLFVSNQGLKQLSGEETVNGKRRIDRGFPSCIRYLRNRMVLPDFKRLIDRGNELWQKHHKAKMDEYHLEAELFTRRKEREMTSRLTNDKY